MRMLKVFAPIAWHADMPAKPCRAVMTEATDLCRPDDVARLLADCPVSEV